MVWTNDNTYGGFSETRLWLPVSLEHGALAAAEQGANPDALLHHYRRVIALRRAQLSRDLTTRLPHRERWSVLRAARRVRTYLCL